MSGDWLKMDSSTPEKPEVLAITARMGWDDPDMAVGKLFRVWRWFDQHTTDGNAARVTSALLDRIAGVSGFAQAMQSEGWLIVSESGLSLPKFDRHNGATAKARAQTAKRVANHRASEDGNAESNAPIVTPALAREEKRREEKKEIVKRVRKAPATSMPEGFGISERVVAWAAAHGHVNLDAQFVALTSYAKRKGATYVDWDEALMTAVRDDWAKVGRVNGTSHNPFDGAR